MSGIATSTTDVVIDTNENVMKNEGKFTKNDEEETKRSTRSIRLTRPMRLARLK